MALKDNKVTESEISSLHVQAAADSYDGDADENTRRTDRNLLRQFIDFAY